MASTGWRGGVMLTGLLRCKRRWQIDEKYPWLSALHNGVTEAKCVCVGVWVCIWVGGWDIHRVRVKHNPPQLQPYKNRNSSHSLRWSFFPPIADSRLLEEKDKKKKCPWLYITSSQAFISLTNLLWRSHVPIFTLTHTCFFCELIWLCTFHIGILGEVQWGPRLKRAQHIWSVWGIMWLQYMEEYQCTLGGHGPRLSGCLNGCFVPVDLQGLKLHYHFFIMQKVWNFDTSWKYENSF